jgi:threonine dehydrogenase-like Zn-dependent dehydrogenase
MRQVIMHAPGDVQVEDRDLPVLVEPTDALIRISASCICGSDLWPYRGAEPVDHQPMGHEYVGVVSEIGPEVTNIKVGDFVVGSFFASDNTCEICRAGYQSRCVHAQPIGQLGTQAEYARIPLADGTLVATPGQPGPELIPSLLAASDVLGTGWFAAVAAEAGPARRLRLSVTARLGCSAFWPRSNSVPSGSSPCHVTPIGRRWPCGSARRTSLRSVATREWPESRSSPEA